MQAPRAREIGFLQTTTRQQLLANAVFAFVQGGLGIVNLSLGIDLCVHG
jgi:hypothetical protein